MITGAQIRMARGYLGWAVKDLSKVCGVSADTIKRMEAVDGLPPVLTANLAKVEAALARHIVLVAAEAGAEPGIRVRKAPAWLRVRRTTAT